MASTIDDRISITDRTYLNVQPAASQLHDDTENTFEQLHELERPTGDQPWYKRIWPSRSTPPTTEWLLATDGQSDSTIEYYIGIDEPGCPDSFDNFCHKLFPDDYQIEPVEWHPARTLFADDALTVEQAETSSSQFELPADVGSCAAVPFYSHVEYRRDWQTALTSFTEFTGEDARSPLTTILETLAKSTVPMIYQVLLHPFPDWSDDATMRELRLREGRDQPGQRLLTTMVPALRSDYDEPMERPLEDFAPEVSGRISQMNERNTRKSFTVTARAVAVGDDDSPDNDARGALEGLQQGLAALGGTYHEIDAKLVSGSPARELVTKLCTRRTAEKNYNRPYTYLPLTTNTSRGIIADSSEAPGFCLVDGSTLTATSNRALGTTPAEQTPIQRPPADVLDTYRQQGFALGYPVDSDGTVTDESIAVPPELQPMHIAWFGKTGAGKSTSLINGILHNHRTTEGADILFDPKGDGMTESYLRAHYAIHGNLDDVYYFDCAETLPAISFFDIRPQLADGIPRTTAVKNVIDHYIRVLTGIMGVDRFERATRSPDLIRYLLRALFDPVNGSDAFSHHKLQQTLTELRRTQDPPAVSDPDLQEMLNGIVAADSRTFDKVAQGAANRIEKIPIDAHLGQMFNNVPRENDASYFDFRSVLDEDAVVIFDTGNLNKSRRAITLVLLSSLWTALQRRTSQADDEELPLVNLYLEEAADLAGIGLVQELLGRSRSFGLSMTLAMQYPEQLRNGDAGDMQTYMELLTNVSTIVTGEVFTDDRLARRLATDDMTPSEVRNKVGSLPRGDWIASLPAAFGKQQSQLFKLMSLPQPAGHPESDEPLSSERTAAFEGTLDVTRSTTRQRYGLDVRAAGGDAGSDSEPEAVHAGSALPYTTRLPAAVEYDQHEHTLTCETCGSRNDPTLAGMRDGIRCCHTLTEVDRDDVPICDLPLNMSANEQRRSPYTSAQLRFLKAVFMAHQQRFDADLEFDILRDSMIRLEEYTGIDDTELQDLIDAGIVRVDCTHPHKLYSLSPEGRKAINERHRRGVTYGDGLGDLSESSLHVLMVELGRRYIEQEYVADPESPVAEAATYHQLPRQEGRLDAVGLDHEGEIVVTLEAERLNNDASEAIPRDYQTMADCHPSEAIWIAKNRDAAHDVLDVLGESDDTPPALENRFYPSTSPQNFDLDQPGFTQMRTLESIRRQVVE